MERKQDIWGPLAIGYFFLMAAAAGAMALACSFDIMLNATAPLEVVAVAFIVGAVGGTLLLAELSQKFRFYWVFANPKSLMAIGAYFLVLFMGATLAYGTFLSDIFPWHNLEVLRKFIAIIALISALVMLTYPALEMAESRGRTFWSLGLTPLFILSGLVSGLAIFMVMGAIIPPMFVIVALALNLIFVATYVYSASISGMEEVRRASDLLIKGELRVIFLCGLACGLIVPAITINIYGMQELTGILILLGAWCFRTSFMKAGVRAELPGERNEFISAEEVKSICGTLENRWKEKAKIVGN